MISATGILALSALLMGGAVDVRSATPCPSSDEVRERLAPLLPQATDTTEPADVAQIGVVEDSGNGAPSLHLQLLRADGHVIGDRSLLLQGNCLEMAETVAAIIAAWETTPMLTEALGQTVLPPVEAAAPVKPPLPVLVSSTPAPVQAPRPSRAFQLFLGAGGGAAVVSGIAATLALESLGGRTTSRWQLRLGATTQGSRQFELGNGKVDWHHTTLAAGLVLHTLHPVWLLSIDAGPAIGWATLAGSGFATTNRRQSSFEYGGTGGLRGGLRLGRVILWADCRLFLWAQGQQARVTVSGSTNSTDLSQADVSLSVGLSVMIF